MRDYMNRRVTPPKRVNSPTWGPSPPCKQTLRWRLISEGSLNVFLLLLFTGRWACNWRLNYNRQLTVFEKILLGIFGVYKTTEH